MEYHGEDIDIEDLEEDEGDDVLSGVEENPNCYRGFGCFGRFPISVGCLYCTVIVECKRERGNERERRTTK